jgi:hypothetical protein
VIRRSAPYLALFFGLSVLYHSNLRPIASGDSFPTSLLPLAILLDHSIQLDRFGPWVELDVPYGTAVVRPRGPHWYSGYPVAGAILVTPLYLPLLAVPGLGDQPPPLLAAVARIYEKFVAVLVTALSAVLLLLLLDRLTGRAWAWILTLTYALATPAWSTCSQALWQHTTGQLALLGTLHGLSRWADSRESRSWLWLAGVSAALALAIRPTNVALIVAVAGALAWVRTPLGEWVRFLLPPAIAGLAVTTYNYWVFQHVNGGYGGLAPGNLLAGAAGLLFSPARGVLFYAPVFLFALAALLPDARPNLRRNAALAVACAGLALAHFAIISIWPAWEGGYCWGPRLLTEMALPLTILTALATPVFRRTRWRAWFAGVVAYCVFIQAVGVYFYPKGNWDHLPQPVNHVRSRLWDWRDNPLRRTLLAGPVWEPYAVLGAALKGGPAAAGRKLDELGINKF